MNEEEATTARLLQLAGARPVAPAERASRVHASVHQRWQSNRRRRAVRRIAATMTALLATAAAIVLVIRMTAPREVASPAQDQIVATGQRVEGAPVLLRQVEGRPARSPLVPDARLRPEDVIETDQVSKAAVRAIDGTSVRLDRGSRARLMSSTAIELLAGSIYISTAEASRGFEVRTPLGVVHDVGTQFEVRVQNEAVRVRVRSGMVEIRRNGGVLPARAGVETTVTPNGVDTRNVPAYGPDWEWMSSVAPPIDIEGRPLQEYLNRLTREEGWTLRYENAAVAEAASRIVLHGTMKGLKTEEALGVALATSGLQYRFEQGELFVFKPPSGR